MSNTGDFSDVFVIDANGRKIPWNEASRISQEEMKELMQTAVNRVYAVLEHEGDAKFEEEVLKYALTFTRGWDEPEGLTRTGREYVPKICAQRKKDSRS